MRTLYSPRSNQMIMCIRSQSTTGKRPNSLALNFKKSLTTSLFSLRSNFLTSPRSWSKSTRRRRSTHRGLRHTKWYAIGRKRAITTTSSSAVGSIVRIARQRSPSTCARRNGRSCLHPMPTNPDARVAFWALSTTSNRKCT